MLVLSRNIVQCHRSMRTNMLILSRNIVHCRRSMRTIYARVEQEYSPLSSIDGSVVEENVSVANIKYT